jgi:hypothetical protein
MTGSSHARKCIYMSLIIAMLAQEKDPWNLNYTIAPIVITYVMAILVKIVYWNKYKVKYNW